LTPGEVGKLAIADFSAVAIVASTSSGALTLAVTSAIDPAPFRANPDISHD
jgi:hypothetical protein